MIKLSVERNKLKKTFARIEHNMKRSLKKIIPSFLEEVKEFQLQMSPWESDSGKLEKSHKVKQVGDLSWELTADPTELGAEYDYAGRLERDYAGAYRWFYPAWDVMKPELMKTLKKEIRNKMSRS